MKLAQGAAISLYGVCRKLGLTNVPAFQNLFSRAYFNYKRRYEDPFSKLIVSHPDIFTKGHILDIGANIGYSASLFAPQLLGSFKVVCFEPEEHNIQLLQRYVQSSGLNDHIIVERAAVGDKSGDTDLWVNPTHPGDHRVLTAALSQRITPTAGRQRVPLWSIDDYLIQKRLTGPVSFIKIDVQGYEWPVCQGMRETLRKNPDIVVALEYDPAASNALGFDARQLLNEFQSLQFNVYYLSIKEGLNPARYADLSSKKPDGVYLNLVFSRRPLL